MRALIGALGLRSGGAVHGAGTGGLPAVSGVLLVRGAGTGGLRDQQLAPGAQWQDVGGGSLAVLPYDAVRATADPAATLLEFFERGYRAGASAAGWDAAAFATGR
jgi:hypothetical protein